ncbi:MULTISPECIES: phenazine-specific anthranilate synthase component I [Streptomyces]|uniref:anthranilate synthase n=4 Tax=Streptomyces venezuelae TaxID=54571 RepID=F2RI82_STRVP|nr:phenazine-specific anthranilate synthase component I [Streptomyces venezuelae]pir/T03800/ anthranilate synthase - Streptomyces violaceus [Streptomyces violaceus]AAC35404.1 anthranilate synthase [Streptomyces venezuelae ATCC 10712]APE21093.1 phenazine-specific anthranilate synthase component I [Streptomyces venezuelae]QER98486.1 phenazine-specific anthranilate synthase component I [Streptomyces venezuelae ATCC 10712]CCA55065.1 2-Amino-2-deoxy-isochorismate synthase [Streptomyces venezuelae A
MDLSRLLDPSCPPFALLRRRTPGRDHDTVEVLIGRVHEAERLAELPVGPLPALALVPFRQIRERGFDVRDDGTPLSVLVAEETHTLPLAEALDRLPAHDVTVEDGGFDVSDEEYAGIVRRVIDEEIGSGEGANFVIRRTYTGEIPGFGRADALALFRRLLAGERGAYWTFVVHTGDRTLVGASPEVHVRMSGGTVVMNPISGTYRYPAGAAPTAEGLLAFLADRKETEELSMVVDEELKMMCTVGDMGGVVIGPRLKEMAHLAHTEYELRGRSSLDVREVLRETMFAATVTGSPVQNACRVIERHEVGGRGYYAGALALLGTDENGAQSLDSPILIRTADIAADGHLRVPVGATLVRHSDPAGEVAETHAKAAGVLTALGVREGRPAGGPAPAPTALADDPRVRAALDARRADLAPFWLRMQVRSAELSGHALVIDAEDTFTAMLAHVLRSSGLDVSVLRYDEPGLRELALAHEGPVVLGPGPGNPSDAADPKMRFLRALTADLVRDHRHGLLGVCLGHELIAAELGLEIVRKRTPFQGAQMRIDLFGQERTVGFYNSFTARCDERTATELALHRIEVSRDAETGEVHALRGPGFAGVQFHPESVLTTDGAALTASLLAGVLV